MAQWDTLHPRAALVRIALELAASAPPGALYELARQAVEDSSQIPTDVVPAEAGESLRKLALTLTSDGPRI